MNNSQKYFDPETLARIRPLSLRAKTLVEGLTAGFHRSPLRGHSIEFAQHREYTPGDDLRQVDWKVYARSDKYYLKQYEDETSLTCLLLLDHSQSMSYRGRGSHLSKLEYAQLLACSLAYLVISQQDRAGLVTFSAEVDDWLPPSSNPSQYDDMIQVMESAHAGERTNLPKLLEQVTMRLRAPSLVVLLSDMFDDVGGMLQSLRLLRSAGHDAIILQVLDRDETAFPFDQMSQFQGLEGLATVAADPLLIGAAYRRAIAAFCSDLEIGCRKANFDYFLMHSDESLAISLPRILASRSTRGSSLHATASQPNLRRSY